MKKFVSTIVFSLFAVLAFQSCNATIGYTYGYHRSYNCNRWNNDCGYNRGWYSGRDYYDNRLLGDAALAQDPASLLASDYGIQRSSAQKIIAVTSSANARSAVVRNLQLSKSDIAAISRMQMPSRDSVSKVAAALGERPAKIERLLNDLMADVRSASKK